MTAADREEAARELDADSAARQYLKWNPSLSYRPTLSMIRAACVAMFNLGRAASTPPSPEPRPYRFPVTDDRLDAPDGAIVDGYQRSGDQWVRLPEPQAQLRPTSAEVAFGSTKPWPLRDCLECLADFAHERLTTHDYDGHGWEELQRAKDEAREYLANWPAPQAEPQKKSRCILLQADTYVAANPATGERARIVATIPVESPELKPSTAYLLAQLKAYRFEVTAAGETYWRDALSELERRLQAKEG